MPLLTTGAGAYAVAGGGGGFSPTATQFLNRTSGLSGADKTIYATLIDGLVTDGVWSKLDFLHIYAAPDSTTALVNLVSSSFTALPVNAPTFTAFQGFLGSSSTGSCLNLGYNPSTAGGNYTQNSASYGVYDRTSATSQNSPLMGGNDGTNQSSYYPNDGGGNFYWRINEQFSSSIGVSINSQGFFVGTRTGSAVVQTYKNGATLYSGTSGSTGVPNITLYNLCANVTGTPTEGYNHQVAADFAGGGLTATDAANFSSRINAYMTSHGTNVY